jgi:hypothetical protein
MWKLMASSVMWFLLFTAAKANATPICDRTISDTRSTTEPAFIYSVTELSALPSGSRCSEWFRNDSFARAGREGALNLLSTDVTGSLRTVRGSSAAIWLTTLDPVVTLSPALPPISPFDEKTNLAVARVGTITISNSGYAGFLPPVSEPVSLLLLGSSLLAIAGMIRRATRSADHSSYEPETSQLPATFRGTNQSALKAQQ